MKILPEPLFFEWDKGNTDKNLIKHDVTNKEVEEIFDSERIFIFVDERHSQSEKRYMIWGVTKYGRKLSIFFTLRKNRIRVILARDMHKKERREYEKDTKINT